MFGQKPKAESPEVCVIPLGRPDGPPCGLPLTKGGAILIGDNGKRTPLCFQHMQDFFHTLLIGIDEIIRGE